MACALGVFAVPEAELEAQLDQVGDVAGLWVGGGGSRGHGGLGDAKGGIYFLLDGGNFNPVSFKFPGEAPVQAGVGVGGNSGVGEAIQEVGRCNFPLP